MPQSGQLCRTPVPKQCSFSSFSGHTVFLFTSLSLRAQRNTTEGSRIADGKGNNSVSQRNNRRHRRNNIEGTGGKDKRVSDELTILAMMCSM